ncbi:MAG: dockerin type I repeat-containing protein, partial [Prevotella sp.]|nr:dockerin type I repeat-containing protein [Prevotella sp.]
NGYFLLDNMVGQGVNYSYEYSLFCGIQPDNGTDEGKSFGCLSYSVDKSEYTAGSKMRFNVPNGAKLENVSFLPFTGVIKAYACVGNISYELGEVVSFENLLSRFYPDYSITKSFTIPTTLPTATYRIVMKSKESGSSVEKEVYSPENPVVIINGQHRLGDVSGDNKVDGKDVEIIVNYILGKNNSADILKYGDMDGDGSISVSDVTAIVNIIKGNN